MNSKPRNFKRIVSGFVRFTIFLNVAAFVFTSVVASAQSSEAESKVLERISAAQKNLSATDSRIASDRKKLIQRLNGIEREVLSLREKTAVARRLADEKTLSLSKLEERLDGWRQQQTYQQNLLHRFFQQHGNGSTDARDMKAQIAAATEMSGALNQRFYPGWSTSDVIMASGNIESAPVLNIGPVTWYWYESENRAGFASVHDATGNTLHNEALLDNGDSKTVAALRQQSQGEIIFDPTLTRALAQQQSSESVLQHLVKGGMWVVPILLFALLALTIALIKAVQLWSLPKLIRYTPASLDSLMQIDTASHVKNKNRQAINVEGMQKKLVEIATSNHSAKQRDDQLFVQLQDDRSILERWIGVIAITAAISPLLGLLGTVSGMIETFRMMTLFGSGDPEVVSGGIAQALVTTELGLVVAIPALVLNAVLSRKAKSYYNDLESFAISLSKDDQPREKNQPTPKKQQATSIREPKSTLAGAPA